ncbi:hypothetical protein STAQ_33690 [Allostella sp. ATCC 35155]|nr:hypothetical protein STAQ_33690 [Stella sp. ATCC 35155]
MVGRLTGPLAIGGLVFALALAGIMTRPIGMLAALWPANAVLLALFVRNPAWSRPAAWAAAAAGYVAADLATGGSVHMTAWLTLTNLVDVGVGYALIRRLSPEHRRLLRPLSVMLLFGMIAIAAVLAALVWAAALGLVFGRSALPGFEFWFVTELVNGIVLVPAILTAPDPARLVDRLRNWGRTPAADLRGTAPAMALVLSVAVAILIGGPGALAFGVPALLWCALSYGMFPTVLLTMAHSAAMLMAAASGLLSLPGADDYVGSALSIRLAVALVTLGPLVVASMRTSLAAAESRWRFALEGAGQGVWDHDFDQDRTFFSAQWKRMIGHRDGEIGHRLSEWTDRLHPDDAQAVGRRLAAAAEGPAEDEFEEEFRIRHCDGGWLWMLGRGRVIERRADGRARRMVGTLTDVTALKTAEARLAALNERMQLALRAAGIGVWEMGFADRRVSWDRGMLDLYGLEPDGFGGTLAAWLPLVDPDDRAHLAGAWARAVKDGASFHEDFRILRATGEVRHVRSVAHIVRGADGRAVRAFGINWDTTAIRAAEAELSAARDEALRANRAKSQFLAVMSHELRTPMTGVIGLADLVLVDDALPDRARERVSMLRASAATLLALVDDILDFSKIEAGHLVLEHAPFSPAAVVQDVAAIMAPIADKGGNRLALSLTGLPGWVEGDAMRLRQVLYNIVGNAAKFTRDGEIRIAASAEGEGSAMRLRFAVEDTGIGMTEEERGRIFEAFTQADASTARRFGGTGLGLAICRRLVAAMGGTIAVESRPGIGSRFAFVIPAPAAASGPDAPPCAAQGAAAPRRILLAEDQEVIRMLMVAMLERMGHQVVAVATGREAAKAAAGGGFDLVLMDIQMPDMDGPAAAAAIRRLPGAAGRVSILGLSADAVPEHRQRHLAADFDAYLTKPIDWPELSATIARLTAQRSPPAPPP